MQPTSVATSGVVNEVAPVHHEKYLWIMSERMSMARDVRRSNRGIGNAEVTDVTAAPLHSVSPP